MRLEVIFTDDDSGIKTVEITEYDFGMAYVVNCNLMVFHLALRACVAIKQLHLSNPDQVMVGDSIEYIKKVNILSVNFLDLAGQVEL